MNQTGTGSEIPRFNTIAEEAEFWDTHDTVAYEAEFASVEATFARPLVRRGIVVPLDAQTVAQLRRIAKKNKTELSVLAQHWILDRLQVEATATHSA